VVLDSRRFSAQDAAESDKHERLILIRHRAGDGFVFAPDPKCALCSRITITLGRCPAQEWIPPNPQSRGLERSGGGG